MPFHSIPPYTRCTVGDTTGNAITPAVAVLDEAGLVRASRPQQPLSCFLFSPSDFLKHTHIHIHIQGTTKMQPGQWVSLKMTKFPSDSPAALKLVDATGATAAAVGACALSLGSAAHDIINNPDRDAEKKLAHPP